MVVDGGGAATAVRDLSGKMLCVTPRNETLEIASPPATPRLRICLVAGCLAHDDDDDDDDIITASPESEMGGGGWYGEEEEAADELFRIQVAN